MKELESQIQNETVILHDDGKRSLDLDEIVESVKNQYANMATRSREEAEYWNKKKVRINKAASFRDKTFSTSLSAPS